jgi:hypothetical protein
MYYIYYIYCLMCVSDIPSLEICISTVKLMLECAAIKPSLAEVSYTHPRYPPDTANWLVT